MNCSNFPRGNFWGNPPSWSFWGCLQFYFDMPDVIASYGTSLDFVAYFRHFHKLLVRFKDIKPSVKRPIVQKAHYKKTKCNVRPNDKKNLHSMVKKTECKKSLKNLLSSINSNYFATIWWLRDAPTKKDAQVFIETHKDAQVFIEMHKDVLKITPRRPIRASLNHPLFTTIELLYPCTVTPGLFHLIRTYIWSILLLRKIQKTWF